MVSRFGGMRQKAEWEADMKLLVISMMLLAVNSGLILSMILSFRSFRGGVTAPTSRRARLLGLSSYAIQAYANSTGPATRWLEAGKERAT